MTARFHFLFWAFSPLVFALLVLRCVKVQFRPTGKSKLSSIFPSSAEEEKVISALDRFQTGKSKTESHLNVTAVTCAPMPS